MCFSIGWWYRRKDKIFLAEIRKEEGMFFDSQTLGVVSKTQMCMVVWVNCKGNMAVFRESY